jgi:Zn-dependent protease
MRLFGIPVKIEPSFFVMCILLASGRLSDVALAVEWVAIVIVSVLIHELGHALMGRRFGLTPAITLHSLGGLTWWEAGHKLKPWQDLAISLAGPGIGFVFGGLIYLARPLLLDTGNEILTIAYRDLLFVNVGWGLFNLLPMLPLDGGQAGAAVERYLTTCDEAVFMPVISLVTAASVASWAVANKWLWVVFLAGWCAVGNGQTLWHKWQQHREKPLRKMLEEAGEAINDKDYGQSKELLQQVRAKAGTDGLKASVDFFAIILELEQGSLDRAEHQLSNFEALYGQNLFLRGVGRECPMSAKGMGRRPFGHGWCLALQRFNRRL